MFGGGFDLDAWTASDSTTAFSVAQQVAPSPSSTDLHLGPVRGGLILREGDWTCGSCHNVNFAKRTRCNKCGALRPQRANEGTATALDDVPHFSGPPGLFKRGDWPCTHCGNVNWARRPKCNVCNAPKPTVTETPRTGRGGGHFDLQDPHDRQQHHSDEEDYDEFGRRKKKNRSLGTPSQIQKSLETPIGDNNMPIKLYFPPPPLCYLKGRTASMSTTSSHSSDYIEPEQLHPIEQE